MGCGPGCDCQCCAGTDIETPARLFNPPGLDQIAYRAGRHGAFLDSMLAQLSDADYPALSALTTRAPADATVALCDALAVNLDVLSFYVERFANEHYLRTATERLSVIEMALLIGYAPAPGVAAATHIAFTLQDLPGVTADPVTIPAGTRIQSVPGQDETAQTFETVAAITADVGWNAIPVRAAKRYVPAYGDTELWLDGVSTGLSPGDAILIVGQRRHTDTGSERWDVRVLTAVDPDPDNARTRLVWADPLGNVAPPVAPAETAVEVHAFRKRAALFGHNAPDPNLFSSEGSNIGVRINTVGTTWSWTSFSIGTTIDIDPQEPKIVSGSWVALVSNWSAGGSADLPGYTEVYRAKKVTQRTRQDFGLSAKITRVTPDTTEHLTASRYDLRRTLVLCQSEALTIAPVPLLHPVLGDVLTLSRRVPGIDPGQPLALAGQRQVLRVAPGVTGLTLVLDDGTSTPLTEGDRLYMTAPAVRLFSGVKQSLSGLAFETLLGASALLRLDLMDRDGRQGRLVANSSQIALAASEKADPTVREIVQMGPNTEDVTLGRDTTTLRLTEAMTHVYDRATLRANANVAAATQGETVEEILGSGDAGRANQRFTLAQSPLTHVSASTASGRASTLQLRVDDVLWDEVPTLFAAGSDAHVFETAQDDDGATWVQFGDGDEGARVPTGATNLRATYRKGLGAGGNLAAGKITTLLSRPLGVSEAVNPAPATGGEDAEPRDRARASAPLTVLTLDRAVSIADYGNFSRAFAGIDKAHALWIPSGPGRGVFVTIGGVAGAKVPDTSDTYRNLGDALRDYGNPLVPIRLENFTDIRFRLKAAVKIDPDHDDGIVLAAVRGALQAAFAYGARAFGQTVSVDEVAAVAHGVAGVDAIHVIALHREGDAAVLNPRLFAAVPVAWVDALPAAAELLTLADAPIDLDVMP